MDALGKIDFGFYLLLFRRRLPLFLVTAVLAGAAFMMAVLLWPPTYQATAKILVESPQIPTDLAKSTVPTSAGEQFQIIQQDLLSRDNLLSLADRIGVYAGRSEMSRTDMFDDMTRRVSIVPTAIASGDGGPAATVFSISFKADQPKLAADLVNDLVTMILNKDVRLRTERATDTVTFFTEETESLDKRLRELDGRVLAFKNEHINALPDSIDFRRDQQIAQQQRLLLLTQEEASLRKRQTDINTRAPGVVSAVASSPEEQNLQSLRQSLAQQQSVFAEDSPTIETLRRRIATLEAAMATPAPAGANVPLSSRDVELADIKDRLGAIAEERATIETTIADLTKSIDQTPGNETVLNSMQRDHQNLQAQYDAAIARLAEASTGQQIELLLKGERLSLIESALPPQVPLGPKQKLLLLGSIVAALLLALAAVGAPELVNRRIRRPAELTSRLQIVPYITVPFVERNSWRGRRLAMGLGMLIAVPALLLVIQTYAAAPIRDLMALAHVTLSSNISKL
ncbi:MAG: Lipopolysaccharide biosynthesis chain length determinant protein [Devosia sp.]|uniref:GumC family protein n=1 Tax=Devosia sp. TaxID=1871048 RepID=UPI002602BF5E|nr:Wzz/FepE/Etk N-terminal domain-containing protein [Devosia sp.]MDB5527020.1 Lipopolysaccharide biosynthesis chain length determinant protein [Devosia sp.]